MVQEVGGWPVSCCMIGLRSGSSICSAMILAVDRSGVMEKLWCMTGCETGWFGSVKI